MAPIPATFDDSTKSTIDNLERRLKDLADFQIPRLRKCTGPLALQQRWNAELRDDLDACAQRIETLELAVDEQHGDVNRKELQRIVTGYQSTLSTLRKDNRSALLASKKAIDASSVSSRDELLRSSILQEKPTGTTTADDALMKANNNVTEALQRTMALMQGELEKSTVPIQMLEDSSAALRAASSQHDTLSLVMGTSKQLIVALERSDWLDRMLILSGIMFFSVIVLFILKQRIVDRGIRFAFWWTRFLPDSSGIEVLDKVERGDISSSVSSIVSSVTTAAITTASSLIPTLTSSALSSSSTTNLDASPSSTLSSWTDPSLLAEIAAAVSDEVEASSTESQTTSATSSALYELHDEL